MKYVALLLFYFTIIGITAQDINQFDVNGNRHGIWKKYYEGTQQLRYQGQFNHGKEIGVFKFYELINNTGVLVATKTFKDQDLTAEVIFYNGNKNIVSEGKMNGKTYVGTWTYYHKASKVVMTKEFYDQLGQLQNEKLVYYKNGNLAEKSFYKDNLLDGPSLWYSESGQMIKSFNYNKGELHGIVKNFDANGNLTLTGQYKDGKKSGLWKYYKNNKLVKQTNFDKPLTKKE